MSSRQREICFEELKASFSQPIDRLRLSLEVEAGLFCSLRVYRSGWLRLDSERKTLLLDHTIHFVQQNREEFLRIAVETLAYGETRPRIFAFYGIYADLTGKRTLRLKFADGNKLKLFYHTGDARPSAASSQRKHFVEKLPRTLDTIRLLEVCVKCVLKITFIRKVCARLQKLWLCKNPRADALRLLIVLGAIAHWETLLLYFLIALFTPLRYAFRARVLSFLAYYAETEESIVEEERANIAFMVDVVALLAEILDILRAAVTSDNRRLLFIFFRLALMPLVGGFLFMAFAPLKLTLAVGVIALWTLKYRAMFVHQLPAGAWIVSFWRKVQKFFGLSSLADEETPRVLYFDGKRSLLGACSLRQRLFPSQSRGGGQGCNLSVAQSVESTKGLPGLQNYIDRLAGRFRPRRSRNRRRSLSSREKRPADTDRGPEPSDSGQST